MDNKKAISLTINKANWQFIEGISQKEKRTKSEIIDYVLDLYRKYQLKSQIQRGFKSQTKEDTTEAMSDFSDYLAIIERA